MPNPIVIGLHAHLDPTTEAAILRIAEKAEGLGIGKRGWAGATRPHMTMGSWYVDEIDQAAFDRMTEALCALGPFPLRLSFMVSVRENLHLNLFPSVQHDLLAYHERVHEALGKDTPPNHQRDIDLPGQWIPHVSFFDCNDKDLPSAMQLIRELDLPLQASVAGFGFARYGGGCVEYVSVEEIERG